MYLRYLCFLKNSVGPNLRAPLVDLWLNSTLFWGYWKFGNWIWRSRMSFSIKRKCTLTFYGIQAFGILWWLHFNVINTLEYRVWIYKMATMRCKVRHSVSALPDHRYNMIQMYMMYIFWLCLFYWSCPMFCVAGRGALTCPRAHACSSPRPSSTLMLSWRAGCLRSSWRLAS